METGPNFKTHACYWPRNELVLAWPQVNELANQDDLNGLGQSYGSIVGTAYLWDYRRVARHLPRIFGRSDGNFQLFTPEDSVYRSGTVVPFVSDTALPSFGSG